MQQLQQLQQRNPEVRNFELNAEFFEQRCKTNLMRLYEIEIIFHFPMSIWIVAWQERVIWIHTFSQY